MPTHLNTTNNTAVWWSCCSGRVDRVVRVVVLGVVKVVVRFPLLALFLSLSLLNLFLWKEFDVARNHNP